MYNYIKGTLTYVSENTVVVEAGGVGYELNASAETVRKLGNIGDICKIYCHLNVSEDDMSLYGFSDTAEKDLFLHLIAVSGIGCKMAISILSSGGMSDIVSAIATADVGKLSKIKGIGKKTAERIVVELRDKLAPEGVALDLSPASAPIAAGNSEAIEALLSLGFTQQEAQAAVAKYARPDKTTEEIVLAALKG